MSERVKQFAPVFITLKHLRPKQRKSMLNLMDREQMRAFEEICLNIVKASVPMNEDHLEICKQWRKPLKMMAQERVPLKEKKRILQTGGFLSAIIPVVASLIGGIIGARNG